jgi:hypothetical protein
MVAEKFKTIVDDYNSKGDDNPIALYKAILEEIYKDKVFSDFTDGDNILKTLIFIRRMLYDGNKQYYFEYLEKLSGKNHSKDIAKYLTDVSNSQTEISRLLENENIKSLEELLQLEKQHTELRGAIELLNSRDISKLQKEVEDYKKQIAERQNELGKLQKELRELKSALEKHTTENNKVYSAIKETDYFKKFRNATSINSGIEAIKDEIEKKLSDFDSLIRTVVENKEKTKN